MLKKIKGFNDYYISKNGVVEKRNRLKESISYKGYVTVTLNGKQYYLHRLLWETFVGEIPDGYEIDHIDTNPRNNSLENLRLVTHKENCNNKKSLENYSKSNGGKTILNNPKLSKQVVQCNLKGNIINTYPSINEAARQTNIDRSSIVLCCKGKNKTSGGFIWKYLS